MARRKLVKDASFGFSRREVLLVVLGVAIVSWIWSMFHANPADIEAKLNQSLSKNKTINAINYSKVQRDKENERLNKEFEPI